jgi:hypothetical protein
MYWQSDNGNLAWDVKSCQTTFLASKHLVSNLFIYQIENWSLNVFWNGDCAEYFEKRISVNIFIVYIIHGLYVGNQKLKKDWHSWVVRLNKSQVQKRWKISSSSFTYWEKSGLRWIFNQSLKWQNGAKFTYLGSRYHHIRENSDEGIINIKCEEILWEQYSDWTFWHRKFVRDNSLTFKSL